ncbi:GNAT family N-acetyltransferase [Aureliella helgolandensis]|uniref:Putative N-acetyltransferase YafP n=1 Tax=Aureliella helgolandensis TaxID=2527968 RepID=A0A518G929_9BACT|nr:GNAT family N-acetyltransferase [Aureliella helgolandensis]QDV25091.1 putative N-acetyltransferase YafP [Aureliella helgolandensis]
MNPSIRLRRFHPGDAPELFLLFRETVQTVNAADYSPQQIAAWASNSIDLAAWTARFSQRWAYVAVCNDRTVGFADMTPAGYLDRLFVSAHYQRQGVARALLQTLLEHAQSAQLSLVSTDASRTAVPFFQAFEFQIVRAQNVECRGEVLKNFHMTRSLGQPVLSPLARSE